MNILIKSKRTFINPWTKKSKIGAEPVSVPFDNLCRSLLRDGSVERCRAVGNVECRVGSEKGGTHTAKNGTKSVGNGTPGVEKKAVTPKKEAPAKVDMPVKNESK